VVQRRSRGGARSRFEDGSSRYRIRVTTATRDPEWDRFLAATPGGNHLQSTFWAEVKSQLGWRSVRILGAEDGRIRGGAQILLRSLPLVGSIAYVSRGPVLQSDDVELRELIFHGLRRVRREHRVRFLVVQPPAGHERVIPDLMSWGFHKAGELVEPHPTATVIVDLSKDEETLLGAMKSKTRYNIRLAQRRGVRVREGDVSDVAAFYRLLRLTSERQRFAVPSPDYFDHMLRVPALNGHVRVFLAEFDGQPLSAAILIGFGDTVSYKRGAWSGQHGNLHPNELMHWTAMRWAKKHGYRYYDLEGIDPPAADATAGPWAPHVERSVSTFKLGFGGEVVLSPGAYERIHNPVLRGAYRWLLPPLLRSSAARWVINTVRTR